MIHVYAFTSGLRRVPELSGIQGRAVVERRLGDVSAIVSEGVARAPTEPQLDDVVAHGLVVEALREEAAGVLPVRYGEQFPDEEAFRTLASERLTELRRDLGRVERCAEMGVRVSRGGDAPAQPASGREYMEQRLGSLAEEDALQASLHAALGRLARDSVSSGPGRSGSLLAAAYLVPLGRLETFRATVEEFAASHQDLDVSCTGPWAPYSFSAGAD